MRAHRFGRAILIALILVFGAVSTSATAQTGKIAVLLNAGPGDLSFNDMGFKGAKQPNSWSGTDGRGERGRSGQPAESAQSCSD